MKANAFLTLAALAGAFGSAWAQSDIVVSEPWIREAPPGAPALAGYMRVENRGSAASALSGARSEAFGMVMIHQSVHEGGMARMVHADRIDLPPGEAVSFEPGGYHLMLMSPMREVKRGDRIEIVLEFSDGGMRPVVFDVRPPGAGVRRNGDR